MNTTTMNKTLEFTNENRDISLKVEIEYERTGSFQAATHLEPEECDIEETLKITGVFSNSLSEDIEIYKCEDQVPEWIKDQFESDYSSDIKLIDELREYFCKHYQR